MTPIWYLPSGTGREEARRRRSRAQRMLSLKENMGQTTVPPVEPARYYYNNSRKRGLSLFPYSSASMRLLVSAPRLSAEHIASVGDKPFLPLGLETVRTVKCLD